MSELRMEELVVLTRAKDGRVDINSRDVFPDPYSKELLLNNGAIDEKGFLTNLGKEMFLKIKTAEVTLKKGIPYATRKISSSKKAYVSVKPWYRGKFKGSEFFTNAEIIAIGTAMSKMDVTPLPENMKRQLPTVWLDSLKKATTEVWPHTFQIEFLGGMEMVWLAGKEQNLFIAVQAKYFDYIAARFPKAKYFAGGALDGVLAKVARKGIGDVVAIIMPIKLASNTVKQPEVRKDWVADEEVQGDKLLTDKKD